MDNFNIQFFLIHNKDENRALRMKNEFTKSLKYINSIMDNDKCIISTSNDQRSDLTTENISTGDYVFDGITDLGQI